MRPNSPTPNGKYSQLFTIEHRSAQVLHQTSSHLVHGLASSISNILRSNTVILDLLINKTILRLRRKIRHLNLIMDHIIHLAVFPQSLHQFAHGDAAEVRRQSGQMLDVSFSLLVNGGALVVRVGEHQDVLRDDLPGAFGDFPYFVVFADEGAVFGYGAAFGDEPGHVEDFELAVVVIPVQVRC